MTQPKGLEVAFAKASIRSFPFQGRTLSPGLRSSTVAVPMIKESGFIFPGKPVTFKSNDPENSVVKLRPVTVVTVFGEKIERPLLKSEWSCTGEKHEVVIRAGKSAIVLEMRNR